MYLIDISGSYKVKTDSDIIYEAHLPGTLDENQIGSRDCCTTQWQPDAAQTAVDAASVTAAISGSDAALPAAPVTAPDSGSDTASPSASSPVITSRFTRKYTYEGRACFTRTFLFPNWAEAGNNGQRIFLEIERSRMLQTCINGNDLTPFVEGTLSTSYVFEVTDLLRVENEVTLTCDNSYDGWPREAILYSSAASDETQTNWNGVLGAMRLRVEERNFISSLRVYPRHGTIDIVIEVQAASSAKDTIHIESAALAAACRRDVVLKEGLNVITIEGLEPAADVTLWDEYEGNLYQLQVHGTALASRTVSFGIREWGSTEDGCFSLNNHRVFLRCETNCCVFPETGHMPMDIVSWQDIFAVYKSYGVNCVRFHSHCPPDAAFTAADGMGILVQPELSHWDPKTAFESSESIDYYQLELESILRTYANHPSFVMLTLGNELHASETGTRRMDFLLSFARGIDATRMYANASNAFYGERGTDHESDFYTSGAFYQDMIRGTSSGMLGHLNNQYPNSKTNYNAVIEKLRKEFARPVFAFEVGQYEILPDFDEILNFKGVTIPDNLSCIKDQVEKAGFAHDWQKRVAATGELALLSYREEIEANIRTPGMSGISLLGLQDFPGQGTALVGMLNAHMQPKPYDFARPERFRAFFTPVLPLLLLEKYTYTSGETLKASISLANYGKTAVQGVCSYQLRNSDKIYFEKEAGPIDCPHSTLSEIGEILIPLGQWDTPAELTVTVRAGSYSSEYSIWVYPDTNVEIPDDICIACSLSEAMIQLNKGRKVFLSPEASEEHFPQSIRTRFTTDFWSVGTFPFQDGYMGCMVDPGHDIFREFPTQFHANWQWWSITNARAMILPDHLASHITALDCYAKLRNLSFLFECRIGAGKLMVSSMGILEKQQYPEAKALLRSILAYMESDKFDPSQVIREDMLATFLK